MFGSPSPPIVDRTMAAGRRPRQVGDTRRIVPADVRCRCIVVEDETNMRDPIRWNLPLLASLLAVMVEAGGPASCD